MIADARVKKPFRRRKPHSRPAGRDRRIESTHEPHAQPVSHPRRMGAYRPWYRGRTGARWLQISCRSAGQGWEALRPLSPPKPRSLGLAAISSPSWPRRGKNNGSSLCLKSPFFLTRDSDIPAYRECATGLIARLFPLDAGRRLAPGESGMAHRIEAIASKA